MSLQIMGLDCGKDRFSGVRLFRITIVFGVRLWVMVWKGFVLEVMFFRVVALCLDLGGRLQG